MISNKILLIFLIVKSMGRCVPEYNELVYKERKKDPNEYTSIFINIEDIFE